jgi:hypothetical protein
LFEIVIKQINLEYFFSTAKTESENKFEASPELTNAYDKDNHVFRPVAFKDASFPNDVTPVVKFPESPRWLGQHFPSDHQSRTNSPNSPIHYEALHANYPDFNKIQQSNIKTYPSSVENYFKTNEDEIKKFKKGYFKWVPLEDDQKKSDFESKIMSSGIPGNFLVSIFAI